jgi:predicted MFS family arabinose efflux permease
MAESRDLAGRKQFAKRLAARAAYHTRALGPVLSSAIRWFGGRLEFSSEFWRFLTAEAFFNFGMFVFVFLYNLYLLQLGFREDFLGRVAALSMVGSVAGSIGAAFSLRRFGARRMLGASFALTAAISLARATARSPAALLGLGAMAGVISSIWPVALAPVVASVTNDRNRRIGFSLVCSSGIAIGIAGGLAASRLPAWLLRLHEADSMVGAYRLAMAGGCAMLILALIPLQGIQARVQPPATFRKFHKANPLVVRFLLAMAVWNLGTGLFNSFRNVFFVSHIHMALEHVGFVFAAAQIAQVVAVVAAPLAFRKFGLLRSIAGMELATSIALFALAQAGGPGPAAVVYCLYMMAQYMSEPGMFTWLMESSAESDRGASSALNLLVMFGGQALGARIGGHVAESFGYPVLLTSAAAVCCGAALAFWVLLRTRREETRSVPLFVAEKV